MENSESETISRIEEMKEKLQNTPCASCKYDDLYNCYYWGELRTAIMENRDLPDVCNHKEKCQDENGYTDKDHFFFQTCDIPTDEDGNVEFSLAYQKYWNLNWLLLDYWHNMPAITISQAVTLLLNRDPYHAYAKLDHWKYLIVLSIVFSNFSAGKFQLIGDYNSTKYAHPQGDFESALVDMKVFFDWSETLCHYLITHPNYLYCCVHNLSIEAVLKLFDTSIEKEHAHPWIQQEFKSDESIEERNQRWQNRANELAVEQIGISLKKAARVIYNEEVKNGYKGDWNTILRQIKKSEMDRYYEKHKVSINKTTELQRIQEN